MRLISIFEPWKTKQNELYGSSLSLIRVCLIYYVYNFLGRAARHEFTTKQTSLLMSEFCRSPYITSKKRKCLSQNLGIGTLQICFWFERQRASLRTLEAQMNWKGKLCIQSSLSPFAGLFYSPSVSGSVSVSLKPFPFNFCLHYFVCLSTFPLTYILSLSGSFIRD